MMGWETDLVMKRSYFYPKVLLFGEHVLFCGSQALTIPFKRFRAKLTLPLAGSMDKQQAASNKALKAFYQFLSSQKPTTPLSQLLKLDAFAEDLSAGLFFDSGIPSGYGLGSSGSLVAATYERYTNLPANFMGDPEKAGLPGLRATLAAMEDYFHGHSSGTDPLSCYLSTPLLLLPDGSVQQAPPGKEGATRNEGFFLLDTESPRKTAPQVNLFKTKYRDTDFRNMINTTYIQANDNCIEAWVKGDKDLLSHHMQLLSKLQFTHLKELIPDRFLQKWEEGLDSGRYTLKLCGAGGGGYILGYSGTPKAGGHPIGDVSGKLIPLNG